MTAIESHRPRLTAAPRPPQKADDADCPVAALAKEAADALPLMTDQRAESGDRTLIDALYAPLDCTQPDNLRDALWDRLSPTVDLARQGRARLLKGAIFQVYLVAHEGRHARDDMAPARCGRHALARHGRPQGFHACSTAPWVPRKHRARR